LFVTPRNPPSRLREIDLDVDSCPARAPSFAVRFRSAVQEFTMQRSLRLAALVLTLASLSRGQTVPQGIYYKFNEGAGTTTANLASPGVGNAFGNIIGGLNWGTGVFGTGLVGTGLPGNANYIDTGYAMNLNGLSWTIEFWWKTPPSGSTEYVCGSNSSTSSFRIFSASTPGANFVLSGTGMTTSILSGVIPPVGTFVHIAYVFDASTSTLYGYVNGVLGVTTPQTGTPVLNTGTFVVGAQSTQGGLNGTLDEFRLWLTARTAAEILASYNTELFNVNLLSATTSGGGAGDLNLSLTLIDPAATEGFTLVCATAAAPVGTGPFFGIWPDAYTWSVVATPAAVGNPLHFYTGYAGVYPSQTFSVPPGLPLSVFGGQTFDFAAVLFAPGFVYVGKSNVSRLTW
jgi:hypothetical protein